jgi:ribosomal protein S26
MPSRPNPRAIKVARCYTIVEAAAALDVSVASVRSWVRQGLPAMTAQRPYLILGDALRGFLQDRREKAKTKLFADQLYCLSCKVAQRPDGMMVDCILQTDKTARLLGLCGTCGGACNRMVSRSELASFEAIFEVAYRGNQKA